jgi:hypothetical protein
MDVISMEHGDVDIWVYGVSMDLESGYMDIWKSGYTTALTAAQGYAFPGFELVF